MVDHTALIRDRSGITDPLAVNLNGGGLRDRITVGEGEPLNVQSGLLEHVACTHRFLPSVFRRGF
ncbi:hypothetical protein [Paracoccus saliphilus]|uniref:Uncharacterized protein n=1 Tax=Paracoccus saliphilus TaxID=405559 RepID=A0AA45W2F8_9RHOB|nr:hypothetical protein [Paracoccus saliphilus]SIS66315.1 hypothetical protein SAMN05421772_102373 [Paracoccus saliphilus]